MKVMGFVIVQLYVPEIHCTEFVILNAKHVGPLMHYISYGFHETFSPEVYMNSCYLSRAKLYTIVWVG